MIKKIPVYVLGFIIIFLFPILVWGAEVKFSGLVPVCNTELDGNGGFSDPCDFNMVIAFINNAISYFVIYLATPLFALILIYVGWLYLSDMGSAENVKKAKGILKNAFIGYIVVLASWLIVKTILSLVGFEGNLFLS